MKKTTKVFCIWRGTKAIAVWCGRERKNVVKDFGILVSLLKEKHKISFKRDMQTGLGVYVCVCVGKSYRQLFYTLKPEKCKIIF